jgi:hypothetical protein
MRRSSGCATMSRLVTSAANRDPNAERRRRYFGEPANLLR